MSNTTAMAILVAANVQQTAEFLRDELGFRITMIYPADDPASAELSGHGLNLLLERGDHPDNNRLQIRTRDDQLLANNQPVTLPNGTTVEIVPDDDELLIPDVQQSLVVSRSDDNASWVEGRAGMQYRDLIPGRLGGRFIASHIRIPDGGPVPDYVHFHQVRFQFIYCYRGWVKVVYEDQGEPFVMQAGDCVLQPPLIRHRVLESSPGLEVIEVGCPAEHYTRVDHDLVLPTDRFDPARNFSGQRFVRHQADLVEWTKWRSGGFLTRDTGIADATDGLCGVRVVKPAENEARTSFTHAGEFLFWFVLNGNIEVTFDDSGTSLLSAGDSVAIPDATQVVMQAPSSDLRLLEVSLPALLPVH